MSVTATPGGLVSVIIPAKNDQEGVDVCLAALAKQTMPQEAFEVVVVDNGSEPALRLPQERPARTRLIACDTPGSYAARNAALDVAEGSLFAFTDADCVPHRDWLENGIARLESDPAIGLVAGHIDNTLPDDRAPRTVELYQRFHAFPQRRYAEDYGFAATANAFTRAEVFAHVGTFDATRASGGDREWGTRVSTSGWQVVFAPDAVIDHPPRDSWSGWWRKMVRVHEGELLTHQQAGNPASAMLPRSWRDVVPPVGSMVRVVRGEGAHLSSANKARYAAGATLGRWSGTAARLWVTGRVMTQSQDGLMWIHQGVASPTPTGGRADRRGKGDDA